MKWIHDSEHVCESCLIELNAKKIREVFRMIYVIDLSNLPFFSISKVNFVYAMEIFWHICMDTQNQQKLDPRSLSK